MNTKRLTVFWCTIFVSMGIWASEYELSLGGQRFDPLVEKPWTPSRGADINPELFLIQMTGTTREAWINTLESQGLEVVQYIHPYTYVVWGPRLEMERSAAYSNVRWIGEFEVDYRLLPGYQSKSEGISEVSILLYRGVSSQATEKALRTLGAWDVRMSVIDHRFTQVVCWMPDSARRDAASLNGVYTLQPNPLDGGTRGEMSCQIAVGNFDGGGQAVTGYQDWLTSVGLSGDGVIAALVDNGTDQDHPDLAGQFLPCTGDTCGLASLNGHGTHTAGIFAGTGVSGTVDSGGFLRGLGMAPGTSLVEQNYVGHFSDPGGMLKLMTQSQRNGALFSSNSWGPAGSPRGYDDDTMQVDIGIRDADPDAPGHQPLGFILAIMNGFGGTSSQGTPDEAKNLVGVGSTYTQNTDLSQRTNIYRLSDNSGHGPALDGRKLPHIVAPGKHVDSTVPGDTYTPSGGTSMACPHVAGMASLFVEYYRGLAANPNGDDPSPALMKAALITPSRNLVGEPDADGQIMGHRPDNRQGWGRMEPNAIVDPQQKVFYFDQKHIFDDTNDQWSINMRADDPNQPMKIMLVWTDAPGHGLGGLTPAWNNDLDLKVTRDGDVFFGNVFDGSGWSMTGGSQDTMNNTEGVMIGPTSTGDFLIEVTAANINSDALPGVGDTTDQDFALVCYNCEPIDPFRVEPDSAVLNLCADEPSSVDVALSGESPFQNETVDISLSGVPAGVNAILDQSSTTLPDSVGLSFSGTAAPGNYDITVILTNPNGSAQANVMLSIPQPITETPSPLNPVDGAGNQFISPLFHWDPVRGGAASFDFELAQDPAFDSVLYSGVVNDVTYRPPVILEADRTYYWRLRIRELCRGPWSDAFSFHTVSTPQVLLVDDDGNAPDGLAQFSGVFDLLGINYTVWDTLDSTQEPDASDMAPYHLVFWFSGGVSGGPLAKSGPAEATEPELAAYLESGGSLILSAQDYLNDRGFFSNRLAGFPGDYLAVDATTPDVGSTQVTGSGDFNALGSFGLSFGGITDNVDVITPNVDGDTLLTGDSGAAAIGKFTFGYRTAFLSFPLEVLSEDDRVKLIHELVEWLGMPIDCYDVTDLNEKVGTWGSGLNILSLIDCSNALIVK